jgi:PEP-CTERM motif-containing protein
MVMLKVRRTWIAILSTVALVASVRAAGADPIPFDPAIHITGGTYVASAERDVFNLTGPQIELHQNAGVVTPKVMPASCAPCAAGDIVNLGFRNPPLDADGFTRFVDLGIGEGVIGGQAYPTLAFSGSLKFTAVPVAFGDTGESSVLVETPFAFRGWVRAGTTPGPFSGGTEFRLRGAGTASSRFVREGGAYRSVGTTTFAFSPVPEPSTVLLFASGLAVMGSAQWRRRRQS